MSTNHSFSDAGIGNHFWTRDHFEKKKFKWVAVCKIGFTNIY